MTVIEEIEYTRAPYSGDEIEHCYLVVVCEVCGWSRRMCSSESDEMARASDCKNKCDEAHKNESESEMKCPKCNGTGSIDEILVWEWTCVACREPQPQTHFMYEAIRKSDQVVKPLCARCIRGEHRLDLEDIKKVVGPLPASTSLMKAHAP